jgi:hypothetical protein
MVSSWHYLETLDQAGKAYREKHSVLIRIFINYGIKSFVTLASYQIS